MADALDTRTPAWTDQQILAFVAEGKIRDDANATPWLDLGDGGKVDVSARLWPLYRLGLVDLANKRLTWRLTDRGRDWSQGQPTDG